MRHRVLGTAGHIDHGKSALVEALTGTHPDRLEEEKRRGITLDLGFADAVLPGERSVAFVDGPGHERFVRHMVAGATGIDGVLLVIAADEGVKPQTREHLAICSLLGVRHGVVALTKSDLVEPDLLEVAALEVREFLDGTFLAAAPVIPVSSRTGRGLDALRAALVELFDAIPDRSAGGVARLPVDRSFIVKGFGTVVTGTLTSGRFAEGDAVEILPAGTPSRIRGLQVHRRRVREVVAGQRTAVNLQGVECADAPRGSTIAHPGTLAATRRVWGTLRLLPGAPDGLCRGGPVRFHQGTCERAARIRTLGEREDGTLDVEIVFREPAVLLPGDRFILRRPSPVDTVGGGEVTDARPPRARDRGSVRAAAEAASPEERLAAKIAPLGRTGAALGALARELGLRPDEAEAAAEALTSSGRVARAGSVLVERGAWDAARAAIEEGLGAYHEHEPLADGMGREELRRAVAPEMPQDVWRALLEEMAAAGRIRLRAERLALVRHRVVLSGADLETAERMDERFRVAGLDPPDATSVLVGADPARAAKILEILVSRGRLVRIRDGRLFHREALDGLERKLRDHARKSRTIDVAAFKDLAGVTRKNAIPLLEHLDAERKTRRVGNVREILID